MESEKEIVTEEEMIQEANRRMRILQLHINARNEFKDEHRINKSDDNMGILFWLDEKEEKMVKELEKKYNFMVYHIIHTLSNLGETYEILFIENNKEEWFAEREDLKNGYARARVEVVNCSENSEFGYIGIEARNGGIVRVC